MHVFQLYSNFTKKKGRKELGLCVDVKMSVLVLMNVLAMNEGLSMLKLLSLQMGKYFWS